VQQQAPAAGTSVNLGQQIQLFTASSGQSTTMPTTSTQSGITIPAGSALGSTAAAAVSTLKNLGLVPTVVQQINPSPPGTVLGTNPSSGPLQKGANIQVIESAGVLTYADSNGNVEIHNLATPGTTALPVPGSGGNAEHNPSVSMDGQSLIYDQNGQLILIQNGSQPQTLSDPNSGTLADPAYAPAPSMKVVAFVRQPDQLCFAQLSTINFTPSCANGIGNGWTLSGEPQWSFDGTKILVPATQNGTDHAVFQFQTGTPYSATASDWGSPQQATDNGDGVIAAAYSPDAKKVALLAGDNTNGFHLYIANATDFQPGNFKLATNAQDTQAPACALSWRSDGQELAVAQPPSGTTACFDPNNNNAPVAATTITGLMVSGAPPSAATNPDPSFPPNQVGNGPDWQPLQQVQ
jgi:hypothetical protein